MKRTKQATTATRVAVATTVDMAAVREARERLREIGDAHPDLIGARSTNNASRWERTLTEREEPMAEKTVQVAFRLSETIIQRLDREARRLEERNPGLKFTRADVVRVLLLEGLERRDVEPGRGNV